MGKRANGEGTIRQRKNGLWEARSPRDELGREIVAYGKTQKEAREKRDKLMRERERGVTGEMAKSTLKEYLAHWMENVIRRKGSPKTHESYQAVIDDHILRILGDKVKLGALRTHHVDTMVAQLEKEGLKRTVKYARDVLRSALTTAKNRGYILTNPASTVVIPEATVVTPKRRPLTLDEARRFLVAIKGHRHEAILRTILSLGLRRGEALGLLRSELDLESGRVTLSGNVQRIEGKLQRLERTKGDEDPVTLALPPSLVALLREHLVRLDVYRVEMAKAERWREHGLVFPSTVGTPIEGSNLLASFKEAMRVAGLPVIRIHDLRHSAASFLIAQGEHPRVVMELLRHRQIATTMEIYGHVEDVTQRLAVSGMERALELAAEAETVTVVEAALPALPAPAEGGAEGSEEAS